MQATGSATEALDDTARVERVRRRQQAADADATPWRSTAALQTVTVHRVVERASAGAASNAAPPNDRERSAGRPDRSRPLQTPVGPRSQPNSTSGVLRSRSTPASGRLWHASTAAVDSAGRDSQTQPNLLVRHTDTRSPPTEQSVQDSFEPVRQQRTATSAGRRRRTERAHSAQQRAAGGSTANRERGHDSSRQTGHSQADTVSRMSGNRPSSPSAPAGSSDSSHTSGRPARERVGRSGKAGTDPQSGPLQRGERWASRTVTNSRRGAVDTLTVHRLPKTAATAGPSTAHPEQSPRPGHQRLSSRKPTSSGLRKPSAVPATESLSRPVSAHAGPSEGGALRTQTPRTVLASSSTPVSHEGGSTGEQPVQSNASVPVSRVRSSAPSGRDGSAATRWRERGASGVHSPDAKSGTEAQPAGHRATDSSRSREAVETVAHQHGPQRVSAPLHGQSTPSSTGVKSPPNTVADSSKTAAVRPVGTDSERLGRTSLAQTVSRQPSMTVLASTARFSVETPTPSATAESDHFQRAVFGSRGSAESGARGASREESPPQRVRRRGVHQSTAGERRVVSRSQQSEPRTVQEGSVAASAPSSASTWGRLPTTQARGQVGARQRGRESASGGRSPPTVSTRATAVVSASQPTGSATARQAAVATTTAASRSDSPVRVYRRQQAGGVASSGGGQTSSVGVVSTPQSVTVLDRESGPVSSTAAKQPIKTQVENTKTTRNNQNTSGKESNTMSSKAATGPALTYRSGGVAADQPGESHHTQQQTQSPAGNQSGRPQSSPAAASAHTEKPGRRQQQSGRQQASNPGQPSAGRLRQSGRQESSSPRQSSMGESESGADGGLGSRESTNPMANRAQTGGERGRTDAGLRERTPPATERPDHSHRQSASDHESQQRSRRESSPAEQLTDASFNADVDRVVERLYRKLERRQRIERERRGL